MPMAIPCPKLRRCPNKMPAMPVRDRLLKALAVPSGPSSDFDLNPGVLIPDVELRQAGVLAAFDALSGDLILTKRSSQLRHHPGQIALPGGKVDPGDEDAVAAALREAHEEVGLDPAQVEVLGTTASHRTVTNFAMVPVIGLIHGPFYPIPEAGEVDEVFLVPFDHIANPENYLIKRRLWRGHWRSYHIVPYGPYYIWGATARVLHSLAMRLQA